MAPAATRYPEQNPVVPYGFATVTLPVVQKAVAPTFFRWARSRNLSRNDGGSFNGQRSAKPKTLKCGFDGVTLEMRSRIGHAWLDATCAAPTSIVYVRGVCIQQHMAACSQFTANAQLTPPPSIHIFSVVRGRSLTGRKKGGQEGGARASPSHKP